MMASFMGYSVSEAIEYGIIVALIHGEPEDDKPAAGAGMEKGEFFLAKSWFAERGVLKGRPIC